MPHIIEFKHPIRRDDYQLHHVPVGTHLGTWVSANLPASANLAATKNLSELESLDITLDDYDAISLRPKLGFGIDWIIWAALAVSVASAVYMYTQMPDAPGTQDTQQASSVYNYNGQGNKPKLGNPVPIQYGRMPRYPDIIAPNWWEYIDNEQYYYQVFSQGVGKFQFHEHYIGETPLTQFDDIEVRHYLPGQTVNHFPHIVWTSKEVGSADGQGGLTLEGVTGDWVAEASSQEARFRSKTVELWSQYSRRYGRDDTRTAWERDEWPWQTGQHVAITQTTQPEQLYEVNLSFHDMGDDGDLLFPDDLPDQIENPLGWAKINVGDRIIIEGAGVNAGTYVVAKKLDGNRIEVNNDGGSSVTGFYPMSLVFCRVYRAKTNDGTYVCKDASGTLALVNSDTLTEVPNWPGFTSMDSPTAELSVLERDIEAQWTGDFLTVPSDATALDVGIDFLFPRGLGEMNDKGAIVNRTVEWQVRLRPAGTTASYQSKNFSLTMADNTPQRITLWLKKEMGLAPGRWEIGARRVSTETDSTRIFDELQWMGLKSVIQRDYVNQHETIITLKIKATNALSQQANQQYWNDCTRIIPVRQPDGQYVEQASRSIAHAVVDACRNNVYGSGLPDDAIDLDTFAAYHSVWESRGDRCDGLFDQPTAFWDAIGRLLLVGRGYPRIDFGSVSMWRDEPRSVLCKPYSPVNMEPDSFSADIRLVEDDDYDGIELEWFNPASRKSETYLATVSNQEGFNPKPLKMPFITSEDHAIREAMFHAAVQAYRRTNIDFSTDIDGWESNYGDVVPITHDALEWGASGQVIEKMNGEDGNHYLQLSGITHFEPGKAHYILFNQGNEGVHGPYRVEPTEVDDIVILIDTLKEPIYAVGETGKKPSEYMFGQASRMYKKCILMQVKQKGEFSVGCNAVEDDPRVDAYA
ncbi:host specificity factor TipJ family phage tail protein [Vibrio parahaemolyticus]|uniref:host specificity factor TipJ family phage tail protein n=1 Tax=Vibrio parahaemolyticus TaxID=670 RepID=UPI00112499BF|nr:host specificity factor TipJ family phage tail protein [Vibrio parahaemolyticus]TPB41792.1 phage tail protein [Vibrio parahaemolyticus]